MIEPGGNHPVSRDWFGLHEFAPGQHFACRGAVCYLLEETSSTSDFLLGRADASAGRRCYWDGWGWRADGLGQLQPPGGPKPGYVAVARRQFAGRGRQGRSWIDTSGLFLSWTATVRAASVAQGLAVWTGLLVARTLEDVFGVPAGLKWPNDLWCDGRKLGGVIVDRVCRGAEALIVIGLGINTDAAGSDLSPALRSRITSIAGQMGSCPRKSIVAGAVLQAFSRELAEFQRSGWNSYRQDLRRLDRLRGRRIDLETSNGLASGTAVGIDDRGALLLKTSETDVESYAAGTVHVIRTGAGRRQVEG